MNFKRKTGAAILGLITVSIFTLPAFTFAGTSDAVYTDSKGEQTVIGMVDGTALYVTEDEQDAIEEYIEEYADSIKTLYITSNDLEQIDVSEAVNVSSLIVDAESLQEIDGLGYLGSEVSGSVEVDIDADDLEDIDFENSDAELEVTLTTRLETLDISHLTNITRLDVSGCGKLINLNVEGDDSLSYLNITGTELAGVDLSDTGIDSGSQLKASDMTLDDQYGHATINEDDSELYDYAIDMDSATYDNADLIYDDDTKFYITDDEGTRVKASTLDEGLFDYSDGVLVYTDDEMPTEIEYTVNTGALDSDGDYITFKVSFEVEETEDRIAGSDRYATMLDINTDNGDKEIDEVYTSNHGNIVVASGEGYADALSASALAGALNTGIFTTPGEGLTYKTLTRLKAMDDQDTAYIVGGKEAVSAAVADELEEAGFTIKRLSGDDRFDTAVAVQSEIRDVMNDDDFSADDTHTVIIASGVGYADALAIAPYAYTQNIPIILVGADGTLDSESAALFGKTKSNYAHALIVGGTSVVSDSVESDLSGYGMDVIRLAGADRYETNLVINDWLDKGAQAIATDDEIFINAGYDKDDIAAFNKEGVTADSGANDFLGTAYAVTGLGYADALAVAPLAGINGGTINMVSASDLRTVREAKDQGADVIIVGGTSAISTALGTEIETL